MPRIYLNTVSATQLSLLAITFIHFSRLTMSIPRTLIESKLPVIIGAARFCKRCTLDRFSCEVNPNTVIA